MDYELCKKLKDAGFPQENTVCLKDHLHYTKGELCEYVAVPTLRDKLTNK